MPRDTLYPGGQDIARLVQAESLSGLASFPGQLAGIMRQARESSRLELEGERMEVERQFRRDEAEKKWEEKRRQTMRSEFLDYADAAADAGATGVRGGTATTRGRRGGTAAAVPTRSVVTDPSGQQVVSGLKFGPGKGTSAADLTAKMFRRPLGDIAYQVEEERRLAETEKELARLKALAGGGPLTVEDRAQQLIAQYNMLPQQAMTTAVRESSGQETPFLDQLAGVRGGPEVGAQPYLVPPREHRGGMDDYVDYVSPTEGALAEGIPEEMRGKPFKKPMGVQFDERVPGEPRGGYKEMLKEAEDFPKDPFRDAAGKLIGPGAAARLVTSETALKSLVEGVEGSGKSMDLLAQYHKHEAALIRRGHRKEAYELEMARKVAWEQGAREKSRFVKAMIPTLREMGITNPEGFAEVYWDHPKQAEKFSKFAADAMLQRLKNQPEYAKMHAQYQNAKRAGEARENLEARDARERYAARVEMARGKLDKAEAEGSQAVDSHKAAYESLVDAVGRHGAFGRGGIEYLVKNDPNLLGMSPSAIASGDDPDVRSRFIAAVSSNPAGYGLDDERVSAYRRAQVLGQRGQELLDSVYTGQQALSLQEEATLDGKRLPETVPVASRGTDKWGRTRGDGGPTTVRAPSHWSGAFAPRDADGNPMDIAGILGTDGILDELANAEFAGQVAESGVYATGKDPYAQTKTGYQPRSPTPGEAEIEAYARRLEGQPYALSKKSAMAAARATAADPDRFWKAFREPPPRGYMPPPPGGLRSRGAAEPQEEEREYPEQYDEDWKQGAYDSGRYELVGGEWRGLDGPLKGRVVPEHKVRDSFGG